MKIFKYLLLTVSFSNVVLASDIPCNVIGTSKDPNLIKLLASGPGANTAEESVLSYKDQYQDAIRCKNKADAARFKMYIGGLEDAIERDNAKKNNALSTPKKSDSPEAPAIIKKITIDCDDESTKPKTSFKISGMDNNGAVVAEGYRGQALVRLIFNNRKPELGRTIEVIINGETNRLSLNPGLGTIGYKPGLAMRMALKLLGMSSDLKINCSPLSQVVIPEPKPEVIPEVKPEPVIEAPAEKIVDDGARDKKEATEPVVPAVKVEQEENSSNSK